MFFDGYVGVGSSLLLVLFDVCCCLLCCCCLLLFVSCRVLLFVFVVAFVVCWLCLVHSALFVVPCLLFEDCWLLLFFVVCCCLLLFVVGRCCSLLFVVVC